MELELQLDELKCYSCVLDTVTRREETQETIVSDALPDIGTILNATATVLIHRCVAMEASVVCEGEIHATVLFQPEDESQTAAVDLKLPLHCTLETPGIKSDHHALTTAAITALDAKVVNPRKVLVRTEVALHTTVYGSYKTHLTTGIQGNDDHIQSLMKQIHFHYVAHVTQRSFPLEETIALGSPQRKIGRLLSCDAVAYAAEAKIVGTKVVFKGGVRVKARYTDGDGNLATEHFEVPVSHVLDAGGCSEQAVVLVQLGLEQTQISYYDENSISLAMDLFAHAVIYEHFSTDVLEDAYSTVEQCVCQFQTHNYVRLSSHSSHVLVFRQPLDMELNDAEVIDAQVVLAELLHGDEEMMPRCRMKASICVKEPSGRLIKLEQSCFVDLPDSAKGVKLQAVLLECSCITAAGGAELRGSLLLSTTEMTEDTLSYVSSISLDEGERTEGKLPSAVLKKLMPGERLWDVGKRYCAKVSDIMVVNRISDENEAAGRFLLIPRHR